MIAIQRRAVVDEYKQFSFARNSVAFGSNGRLYYPHQARFEVVNGRTGVLVEEGTTNLLTANQSSVETDTTGFVGERATISRDTSKAWHGGASLKVVTDVGALYPGASTDRIAASPNTAYSAQVEVNFPMGEPGVVWLQFYDSANTHLQTFSQTFTGTSGWQRVTVTGTSPANTARVRISVRENRATANGITYWVDGLQIEQKSYPTSWTLGTRAAETLTVPKEVVNLTEGTIEAWALFNDVDTSRYGAIFAYGGSAPGPRLLIMRDRVANDISVWDGDGVDEAILDSTTVVTTNTWYYVAFTWSAQGRALYVNGQKQATNTRSKPLGTPPENPKLGLWGTGNYLNGLVAMVRISRRARTDQEIADAYAAGTLTTDADTTLLLPMTGPDAQRGARVVYVPAVGF